MKYFVDDLPLLHILSEKAIFQLSKQKGWTKEYAAAWSYLYFKKKLPPSHLDTLNLTLRVNNGSKTIV